MREPICIFRLRDETLNPSSELIRLINQAQDSSDSEDILDYDLVLISIAGRFRQGKSFLMNLFIRFVRHLPVLMYFLPS